MENDTLKLHLILQKRFNVILLLKTTPNTPILEAYQSSIAFSQYLNENFANTNL
jgi:hypothetical protein